MPGLDSSIPDARKLFDLNFFSALETMQAFGPMLINAKGVVVNNASVGGMGTFPFGSKSILMSWQCCAKHSLALMLMYW